MKDEKKISDLTIDEFKSILDYTIRSNFEGMQETIEIMHNKKLMNQIKKADRDWKNNKNNYKDWKQIKNNV